MKVTIEFNLEKRILKAFNKKTKKMYQLENVVGVNFLEKENLLVVTFLTGEKQYYNDKFELVETVKFNGKELVPAKKMHE